MAIPELQRQQVERGLRAYCEDVPARVRDQLRYSYTVATSTVELYEERPPWDNPTGRWIKDPVAKFRYIAKSAIWELYCMHGDLKWHGYERLPSARRFDVLLAEVERDPTGIFWG